MTMIADLIMSRCKTYASRPALVIGKRSWTYAEMERVCRRWASRVLDATDGRPQRVGVLAYRSETSYLGVLAYVFAGAAFVPLNPRFPVERTARMINSAGLDAIFVDANALAYFQELRTSIPMLVPELEVTSSSNAAFGKRAFDTAAPLSDFAQCTANDLAYLLFTSGSTGQPKGVPITHGNLISFITTNLSRYDFGPNDRFSQTFDQTFDLSLFDILMAWSSGACVYGMQSIELLAPSS